MKGLLFALSSAIAIPAALASVQQQCLDGLCFSVNIPEQSAKSGSGPLFFQISAPDSNEWVCLGQGTGMKHSSMFVMYLTEDGKNVTISPRLGEGHVMPVYDNQTGLTVLSGSGVANGMITANVRCDNCTSWSGGAMSFTDASSSWIYASKSGSPIMSNDLNETIPQHDSGAFGSFQLNLLKATGGNSSNPFLNMNSTSNSTDSAGDDSATGEQAVINMQLTAHIVLMTATFMVILPLGALSLRLLHIRHFLWLHAMLQLFGLACAGAGLGLGVNAAIYQDELTTPHAIFGMAIVGLLLIQPILGILHHFVWVKVQRRTVWGRSHVWIGRMAIIGGLINGGLGLQLSGDEPNTWIFYSIGAGAAFFIYALVLFSRRPTEKRNPESSALNSPPSTSAGGEYAPRRAVGYVPEPMPTAVGQYKKKPIIEDTTVGMSTIDL